MSGLALGIVLIILIAGRPEPPDFVPGTSPIATATDNDVEAPALVLGNGIGGFADDGRDYAIVLCLARLGLYSQSRHRLSTDCVLKSPCRMRACDVSMDISDD